MRRYLLPERGNFYKANLHSHTTLSDGYLTPEMVKRAYKEKGYSVVAFTDHFVMHDHSSLCDDDFVAINGYELILNGKHSLTENPKTKKSYHLNLLAKSPSVTAQVCFSPDSVWGKAKDYIPFVSYVGDMWDYSEYSAEEANKIIAEANANGFAVCYNHPAWSLHTSEDYCSLSGLLGVEVVNGTSVVNGFGDDNSGVYSQMLYSDLSLVPIAADDNHNEFGTEGERTDSFVGFNMIKAEKLDYESVMRALENRHTYASSGPLLHELYIENDTLHVKCSPVCRVILSTLDRGNVCIQRQNGETLTECDIPLNEKRRHFRIELVDACGNRAFSCMYTND